MERKSCSIKLFIIFIYLSSACEDDTTTLRPSQKLLISLHEAGFQIEPGKPKTRIFNRMMDYSASECYQVRYYITDLNLCFHHFKSTMKALEAKTFMEKSKWPPGRFWIATVWRNSVVQVDSQMKDRATAIKLVDFFK